MKAAQSDNQQVVRDTVKAVLARDATAEEISEGTKLIAQLETQHKIARERAVELYCMTVMNWNEFLFVD